MKKVLVIGQAPPLKVVELPFGGTKLFKWLETISITYKKVQDFEYRHNQEGVFLINSQEVAKVKFGALINYFPGTHRKGGHLAPTKEQIEAEKPFLKKLISNFEPDILIPIGKLSLQEALGLEDIKLNSYIGKEYIVDPYLAYGKKITIIPLPHPSGASTWHFKDGNKKLLAEALSLIRTYLLHPVSNL